MRGTRQGQTPPFRQSDQQAQAQMIPPVVVIPPPAPVPVPLPTVPAMAAAPVPSAAGGVGQAPQAQALPQGLSWNATMAGEKRFYGRCW